MLWPGDCAAWRLGAGIGQSMPPAKNDPPLLLTRPLANPSNPVHYELRITRSAAGPGETAGFFRLDAESVIGGGKELDVEVAAAAAKVRFGDSCRARAWRNALVRLAVD